MKSKCSFILFALLTLLCWLPSVSSAQNIRVEGTVQDESGEAMIGVSVLIKGQGTGTVTDFD